ncbi:MAG: hypothetical protein WAV40_04565 [Microgenomates group bacterium]
MKRRVHKTRWNLIILLLIASVLSYAGYKYLLPHPQSAEIFLITPASLDYGDTTISGVLRKDTAVGEKGNYLVILPDSRPVLLDIQGLDNLIGAEVSVTGYLTPLDGESLISMKVSSLTLK